VRRIGGTDRLEQDVFFFLKKKHLSPSTVRKSIVNVSNKLVTGVLVIECFLAAWTLFADKLKHETVNTLILLAIST
jgi:hypothetical protein